MELLHFLRHIIYQFTHLRVLNGKWQSVVYWKLNISCTIIDYDYNNAL